MFPHDTVQKTRKEGFPRIRGDVPSNFVLPHHLLKFSPHTRGCSWVANGVMGSLVVFPAYAGMFRNWRMMLPRIRCFPRIRGDVPGGGDPVGFRSAFSPHTRGCSDGLDGPFRHDGVFPAYAGMFLNLSLEKCRCSCFPRIRGDVPRRACSIRPCYRFSPHTRGCSVDSRDRTISQVVFPAYAGMFLFSTASPQISLSFPRIRGDVPRRCRAEGHRGAFSPHTRGCSWYNIPSTIARAVFPAYAGMFLPDSPNSPHPGRFPRLRGDVPQD